MALDIDRLLQVAARESPTQIVYDAIRDAMWPFRADVWTWIGDRYEIDYDRYTIYIEIRIFPDDCFVGHLSRRDLIDWGPNAGFDNLARLAFLHFRNLRQDPEDNIILGEN